MLQRLEEQTQEETGGGDDDDDDDEATASLRERFCDVDLGTLAFSCEAGRHGP
jgi:hypothetical protein